jgi:hypothetical protein
MEHRMANDGGQQIDRDVDARAHFDRMTREFLRSILSDELIEEHRRGEFGHVSEPLWRLLAWCHRRPLTERYAVKAEADGSYRLIKFTGRRGQAPDYVGDKRHATLHEARHEAFLRHISDLTET